MRKLFIAQPWFGSFMRLGNFFQWICPRLKNPEDRDSPGGISNLTTMVNRTPQFRFEKFNGISGLLKLVPAWRELTPKVEAARHFHSVDWFIALAQTLDQYGDSNYLFVAIFDSSELVGVIPLRRADIGLHGVQLKALQLLSNIRETPATRDIILAKSVVRTEILAEFIRYLDGLDDSWDVVVLPGLLEDSCAMTAVQMAPKLHAISTPGGACGYATFISCGLNDAPFNRLSKGFRQNLRTAHNKLVTKEATFVCACKPDGLMEFYPKFVSVESSGWKRNESSSIINHPQFDSFLRQLISQLGPLSGCEIHLMQLSGRTVAGLLCVVLNNICFLHVVGYDETYSQLSPVHLLIENLIMTRGGSGQLNSVTTYHAPEWFSSWKPDRTLNVSNIHLFRPSKRGAKLRGQMAKSCPNQSFDTPRSK